jgi:hypothetical protein
MFAAISAIWYNYRRKKKIIFLEKNKNKNNQNEKINSKNKPYLPCLPDGQAAGKFLKEQINCIWFFFVLKK